MEVAHVGLEHRLQLLIRLLDFPLILLQLDVDFVHLVAHRVVLRQNLVQLLAQVSEQLAKQRRVVTNLVDIKLIHDFRQRIEHLAGFIQLAHVHAAQDNIRCLGDFFRRVAAEGNNRVQVVDVDAGSQRLNFRRMGKLLLRRLLIRNDVIGLHFHQRRFRLGSDSRGRCACGTVEIHCHCQLPLFSMFSSHERLTGVSALKSGTCKS